MCGVKRISRPAPNWPIASVVAPRCSVVTLGENGIIAKVNDVSLTAAEDRAASRPNIRREARTMDRITQCERTQNRPDRAALVAGPKLEDLHSRNVYKLASCIDGPSFDSDAEIPAQEILCIQAAAPRMVRFDVTIIPPLIARKNVRTPKAYVEFVIRIPLGARRRGDLLHFFTRLLRAGKSDRGDRRDSQKA